MSRIHTITFNPSLDYIVRMDELRKGEINRVSYENILPGGKGINVSVVLSNLGHATRALGFIANFTGQEIASRLESMGIEADFIDVPTGMSRINVKIKAQEETEINGQGPAIEKSHIEALFTKLDEIELGDILVISGSVPQVLPQDMYEQIMRYMQGREVEIVVDATRDLLMRVLPYRPLLIKPNNIELGEIFDAELNEQEDVIPYAQKLQEQGAQNVLISMAGKGAVLVDATGEVHRSAAPKGEVVNSVGAGDSMVAGFLSGLIESEGDYETAFKWGLCTGSASAFSPDLATREEVEALLAALEK